MDPEAMSVAGTLAKELSPSTSTDDELHVNVSAMMYSHFLASYCIFQGTRCLARFVYIILGPILFIRRLRVKQTAPYRPASTPGSALPSHHWVVTLDRPCSDQHPQGSHPQAKQVPTRPHLAMLSIQAGM